MISFEEFEVLLSDAAKNLGSKVGLMIGLYCSSAITFADHVLLFDKYVG